jgi:hypothetical protein
MQILRSFPDAKLTPENLARLARTHVQLETMARGLSYLRRALIRRFSTKSFNS